VISSCASCCTRGQWGSDRARSLQSAGSGWDKLAVRAKPGTSAAAVAASHEKPSRRSLEEAQEGKGWSSTAGANRPALRVCLWLGDFWRRKADWWWWSVLITPSSEGAIKYVAFNKLPSQSPVIAQNDLSVYLFSYLSLSSIYYLYTSICLTTCLI
jgi:hypothetical protein